MSVENRLDRLEKAAAEREAAAAAREAAALPNPVEIMLADPAARAAALAWDREHLAEVTGQDVEERAESLRALLAEHPPAAVA
jgi:hypothetical protein